MNILSLSILIFGYPPQVVYLSLAPSKSYTRLPKGAEMSSRDVMRIALVYLVVIYIYYHPTRKVPDVDALSCTRGA